MPFKLETKALMLLPTYIYERVICGGKAELKPLLKFNIDFLCLQVFDCLSLTGNRCQFLLELKCPTFYHLDYSWCNSQSCMEGKKTNRKSPWKTCQRRLDPLVSLVSCCCKRILSLKYQLTLPLLNPQLSALGWSTNTLGFRFRWARFILALQ